MFGGVWSYVVAGGLALAFLGGVYQTGYNAAMRTAQVETIKAEREVARDDLAKAKAASDQAAAQVVTLTAEAATDDAKLKELTDALATRGRAGACTLGGDVARRLRDVR